MVKKIAECHTIQKANTFYLKIFLKYNIASLIHKNCVGSFLTKALSVTLRAA